MKFAHIADIHIKNLKHHGVYENVFGQLYNKLEKEKVNNNRIEKQNSSVTNENKSSH